MIFLLVIVVLLRSDPHFPVNPTLEVCSLCWWPWDVPDSDGEACVMDVLRVPWRFANREKLKTWIFSLAKFLAARNLAGFSVFF